MYTTLKTPSFVIPSKHHYPTELRNLIKQTKQSVMQLKDIDHLSWESLIPLVIYHKQSTLWITQLNILRYVGHYDQYNIIQLSNDLLQCNKLSGQFDVWFSNQYWIVTKLLASDTEQFNEIQQMWIHDYILEELIQEDSEHINNQQLDNMLIMDQLYYDYDSNLNSAFDNNYMEFTTDELQGVDLDYYDFNITNNIIKIPLCSEYVYNILTYCTVEPTRHKVLKKYNNVCSNNDHVDNTNNVLNIINNKLQLSKLLNFNTITEQMCSVGSFDNHTNVEYILHQLNDCLNESIHHLFKKISTLSDLSWSPWNVKYLSNTYCNSLYGSNIIKEVNECVSVNSFNLCLDWISKHTDLSFKEVDTSTIDTNVTHVWDNSVRFYEVYHHSTLLGGVYIDIFMRDGKDPAQFFMTSLLSKDIINDQEHSLAIIVCCFDPYALTFQDIIDFSHELGHSIHLLSSISPISSRSYEYLELDIIEFSSVLLETILSNNVEFIQYVCNGQYNDLSISTIHNLIKIRKVNKLFDLVSDTNSALKDILVHSCSTPYTSYSDIIDHLSICNTKSPFISMEIYDNELCTFNHIMTGAYTTSFYSYILSDIMAFQVLSLYPDIRNCLNICITQLFSNETIYPFLPNYELVIGEKISMKYLLNHLQTEL